MLLNFPYLVYTMDSLVAGFFTMFNKNYEEALELDFTAMSLQQQIAYINHLFKVWTNKGKERSNYKNMIFLLIVECFEQLDGSHL